MPTATLKKFGYPESLVKTYQYWHVLLRPAQPTLGSLVLICKESVTKYSEISVAAMTEKHRIVADIETVLSKRFDYSKINHLMLMMVDPAVHFHVIPRCEHPVEFCDKNFEDKFWPSVPDLSHDLMLGDIYQHELLKTLRNDFTSLDEPRAEYLSESKKTYHRMYTSGCFDIFHQGHLNVLRRTKELCDYLIVGVSTDDVIIQSKGRPPLIPFEERITIVEAIEYVDEVIPQINKDKQAIVDQYKIDAISVGSDWKGKYPSVTCDMVYFDYTPNVSSTALKQKLNIDDK